MVELSPRNPHQSGEDLWWAAWHRQQALVGSPLQPSLSSPLHFLCSVRRICHLLGTLSANYWANTSPQLDFITVPLWALPSSVAWLPWLPITLDLTPPPLSPRTVHPDLVVIKQIKQILSCFIKNCCHCYIKLFVCTIQLKIYSERIMLSRYYLVSNVFVAHSQTSQ